MAVKNHSPMAKRQFLGNRQCVTASDPISYQEAGQLKFGWPLRTLSLGLEDWHGLKTVHKLVKCFLAEPSSQLLESVTNFPKKIYKYQYIDLNHLSGQCKDSAKKS